jgi:uncharacterized protein YlxW (UPF0749 family)
MTARLEAGTLMAFVSSQGFDADYRTQQNPAPNSSSAKTVLALGAAALGLLITVSLVQSNEQLQSQEADRDILIEQVSVRRDWVAQLQDTVAKLETDARALREQSGILAEEALDAELSSTQAAIQAGGTVEVGSGLTITATDGSTPEGRIRDTDLVLLVSGLWQAGATAVVINGERLTALSAVRNSGSAIHVNGIPLSPPYEVIALGNSQTLEARLLESEHGRQWNELVGAFRFGYRVAPISSMAVPAADPVQPRFAQRSGGEETP